uniref:ANF_receptor domain-containing protein n=1 Tax=Ascaris lumbricoides TaxID=6252 RepID=A0A0M3HYQ1_ASCLU
MEFGIRMFCSIETLHQRNHVFNSLSSDDVPIAVSSPHFLGATREVTRTFLRLQPDPTIHQSTYDIEPCFRTYQSMLQATYPILWMNESIMIDDNSVKELSAQLTQPYETIKIICWAVGVGVGSLCVIVALVMCIFSTYSFAKNRPNDERDETNDSNDIYPMFIMRSNMRQRCTRHLST